MKPLPSSVVRVVVPHHPSQHAQSAAALSPSTKAAAHPIHIGVFALKAIAHIPAPTDLERQ